MTVAYNKSCLVCGKAFVSPRPFTLYCSARCNSAASYRRSKGLPVANAEQKWERICRVCGNTFTQKPHVRPMHYCSEHCKHLGTSRRLAGHLESLSDRYCARCGAPIPQSFQLGARYCSNRCRAAAGSLRYIARNRESQRAKSSAYGRAVKLRVIEAYGDSCSCCGVADPDVLTIDHLAAVGRRHRAGIGYGKAFYLWLERQGFPQDDYRLLCLNCNAGRERNAGTCPHHGRVDDPSPFVCVVCGGQLDGGDGQKPVCQSCRDRLRREHGTLCISACIVCGAPTVKPKRGQVYFCPDCAAKRRQQRSRWIVRRLLHEAVDAYGGRCTLCGEEEVLFLTIDHVHGGGEADRKLGRGGVAMYYWLRDNRFPDGFQVLCWNCNWKKGRTVTSDDGVS